MTTASSPFGLRPVFHPSGVIRQRHLVNGIASGYATAIYTGTPVKPTTDGTLVASGTGADNMIGVFQGVEFSSAGAFRILPYWPASQTYDADGLMEVYFTFDKNIVYEAQMSATVASTVNFETTNLTQTSQGSVYTGQSTQTLTASTTGASAGLVQIIGIAPYSNNAWGDTYPIVRCVISTYSVPVA